MWKDNFPPIDRFQKKDNTIITFDRFQTKKRITIMWEGNLLPFDRFQKKTIQLCEGANYFQMSNSRKKTDSTQKNNYNYARGQITT